MDLTQKISALGESAQYDLCSACGAATRTRDDLGRWIYPAALPDGKRVRVLKVLMTNVCEKNCYYCGVRASRDVPRTSFTPDELARAFDRLCRADLVDGLFLSSGVCAGADHTMERMLATVELIRVQYGFAGSVHLKLLPGMIAGSIVVEYIFSIPGMGSLSVEALASRDYPLMMALFTIGSALSLLGILISDLLYGVVDPRVSLE